jgi:hypothetical protein
VKRQFRRCSQVTNIGGLRPLMFVIGRYWPHLPELGTGANPGHAITSGGTRTSDRGAATATGLGAPLRPRRAVRFRRLHEDVEEAPGDSQHEPSRESIRKRQLREFHQDAQTRRDLRKPVSGPGALADQHRRVHRAVLQSMPATLGLGIPIARGVRAGRQFACDRSDDEFFQHTEIYRSDGRRWKRRKPTAVGFPAHCFDESPIGYSLADCSPAEPTSASPAHHEIKEEKSV